MLIKTAYEKGRKACIKEVVDWITQQELNYGSHTFRYCLNSKEWQAKLKEWGLTEGES